MASSKNFFDVLAEPGSSSKEPENTDQVMGDTPQAGPSGVEGSLSMGDLEDTLPTMISLPDGVALFKKRGADLAFEQEERKKRLRPGNPAMIVGEPIRSAAPATDHDMEEDDNAIDCRIIINPDRRLRRAFQYADANGFFTAPLGDV